MVNDLRGRIGMVKEAELEKEAFITALRAMGRIASRSGGFKNFSLNSMKNSLRLAKRTKVMGRNSRFKNLTKFDRGYMKGVKSGVNRPTPTNKVKLETLSGGSINGPVGRNVSTAQRAKNDALKKRILESRNSGQNVNQRISAGDSNVHTNKYGRSKQERLDLKRQKRRGETVQEKQQRIQKARDLWKQKNTQQQKVTRTRSKEEIAARHQKRQDNMSAWGKTKQFYRHNKNAVHIGAGVGAGGLVLGSAMGSNRGQQQQQQPSYRNSSYWN